MSKSLCATTVLTLIASLGMPTLAQEISDDESSNEFEPEEVISVVATRSENPVAEVATMVTVKSSEEIEEELIRDIADLVRYEPGVTVEGTGSRFGLTGFSIRGIGGNRVLTVIDGVRIPDEFSFGPFLSSRRDFVDVDSLSRVEIARGPVSSLYGSDALGGVVAFSTKSAGEVMQSADDFFASLKAGYSSEDASRIATATLGAKAPDLAALLVVSNRNQAESENAGEVGGYGPSRELPDPREIDTTNVTAKVTWNPSESHMLSFSVENYSNDASTMIYSDYGVVVYGTVVNSRDAEDTRDRTRVSVHYSLDGDLGIADAAELNVFNQNSETDQSTFESRTSRGQPQTRQRLSFFDQKYQGFSAQLRKSFDTAGISHSITYGFERYSIDSQSRRDGGTFDAAGTPLREYTILPTRDFPLTDIVKDAIYVQDEIELLDGKLLLSPSVRFDRFDAEATADSIYLNGNPGQADPADFSDSELTKKIGAVGFLSDQIVLFGNYSEGFRAPPYDDVNVGFTNFGGGYKTISNADLLSERSQGIEAGIRLISDFGVASVGAFSTEYTDFIESFSLAPAFLPFRGIDPSDGMMTFQSINRGEVSISGIEAKGEFELISPTTKVRFALAFAEGTDEVSDQPLNSINPLTTVLGLRYDATSRRWGTELVWTLVSAKEAADISESSSRAPMPGYGVVDLLVNANLGERFTMNMGVFNLTDKRYIRWEDSLAIGGDAPLRFTQPGVNAGITIRAQF